MNTQGIQWGKLKHRGTKHHAWKLTTTTAVSLCLQATLPEAIQLTSGTPDQAVQCPRCRTRLNNREQ